METETFEGLIQNKIDSLIEKYSEINLGYSTMYFSKIEARQLALMVCDEILNDGKMLFCGDGVNDIHYKFWEKVKEGLINIK